jgi:hypothetical protein
MLGTGVAGSLSLAHIEDVSKPYFVQTYNISRFGSAYFENHSAGNSLAASKVVTLKPAVVKRSG